MAEYVPPKKLRTSQVVILNGVRAVKHPGILRCAQNDREWRLE